jgi:glycosyltransferase involved in cell wall biosynthesis
MKISIVTPDFSHNCLGRAWLLAKLLQPNFDIEMIGPAFGNGIWEPLKDECDFPIKVVKGYPNGQFEFKKMLRLISGEVIYASKPLMPSFGVGLVKKILKGKPLVLDIDDWELGFGKEFYDSLAWHKKINDFRLSLSDFTSYYYSMIMDRLIPLANAVTVAGDVLADKYGGIVIWHCRDTALFDPSRYNNDELKRKHLHVRDNSFIVSFIGTPRPHKGLHNLIDAIEILDNEQIFLLIVGMDENEYCRKLIAKINSSIIKDRVIVFPEQSFKLLPEYLAISDLVVIPQRETSTSLGQVPAKIFDAMAMAKPIISTGVYDIPNILDNCGWIVQDGKMRDLAEKIFYVFKHRDEAIENGLKARERCIAHYNLELMREKTASVFKGIKENSL